MDNKDYKNENVEKFFLETVHKKESLPMDICSFLLNIFYQETCNPKKFNSELYENQDSRIEDMFSSAPESLKDLLKLKAYQHQLKKQMRDGVIVEEKNRFIEKRIEGLLCSVSSSKYKEYIKVDFWLP